MDCLIWRSPHFGLHFGRCWRFRVFASARVHWCSWSRWIRQRSRCAAEHGQNGLGPHWTRRFDPAGGQASWIWRLGGWTWGGCPGLSLKSVRQGGMTNRSSPVNWTRCWKNCLDPNCPCLPMNGCWSCSSRQMLMYPTRRSDRRHPENWSVANHPDCLDWLDPAKSDCQDCSHQRHSTPRRWRCLDLGCCHADLWQMTGASFAQKTRRTVAPTRGYWSWCLGRSNSHPGAASRSKGWCWRCVN